MASVPNVKHSKAIQQAIRVAEFTGYERVNMVEIDGLFYWTGSWTEEANGMMRYVLDLAAPTSFVRLNDAVTGIWSKTPTMTCPYMKETISNSMDQPVQVLDLPNLGTWDDASQYPIFWVQQSGRTSQGDQRCVGFFAALFPGTTVSAEAVYSIGGKQYPDMGQFLADMVTYTGILAEDTDDLSISVRAPFRTQASADNRRVMKYGEEPMREVSVGGASVWLYNLPLSSVGLGEQIRMDAPAGQSDVWRSIGRVFIRDTYGASILEVPTYGEAYARVYVQTRMDRSGVYTEITTIDPDGEPLTTLSYTEGKLPFNGSTWETYKAYQMEGDRQQMANAISVNNRQQEIDQKVGIANAAMDALFTGAIAASNSSIWDLGSGAAVGAAASIAQGAIGTAISIWESEHVRDLKNDQARMDYELTQKRAVMQPTPAFQPGYGTVYTWTQYNNPLAMVYSRPDAVDSDYYTAWRANYGYASEGQQSLSAVAGFYQGKLLARSDLTGVYFDELNADFNKGFKFKVLT